MIDVRLNDLVVGDGGTAYLVAVPSEGDRCEGCNELADYALRPLAHSAVPVTTVAYCRYDLVNTLLDVSTPDRLYRPAV